ncbi:MAG: PUR family DNA/RNA-binding protein [Flavobacteriales bacterium]|nr:PUR family DNA/RNA-binding protein [Flavobacteriales bacterium]
MADDREDVYSKAVRAGKRTYFFDVKSTRGRDLYLTITESKKHTNDDGSATYEKHKIFLYKEDFEKFLEGYKDAVAEIERLKAGGDFVQREEPRREDPHGTEPGPTEGGSRYTDVDFDDLDKK